MCMFLTNRFSFARFWGAIVTTAALTACVQAEKGSTVLSEKPLGTSGTALLTSADVRLVASTTPRPDSQPGRVRPTQITCIEPSPDIAKAVHESFNFGGSLGLGGLPSGVSADLALAFAKARAESVAQMTERLATIQLLRDGLYRACEAYANGAISDTTYAVLLSRYDDTMVTLLMGELAAGNFGRQLATLGGATGGSSNSALVKKVVDDQQAADKAAEDSAAADETVAQRHEELGAARARRDAAEPGTAEHTAAEKDVEIAEANLAAAEADRALKEEGERILRAAANSSASAFAQAAGGVAASSFSGQDRAAIAQHLGTMQRKYIENINADALMVACISTLDRVAPASDKTLEVEFAALAKANEDFVQHRLAVLRDKKSTALKQKAAFAPEHREKLLVAARDLANAAAASDMQPLARYCLSGILPQLMGGHQAILELLKSRSWLKGELETFEDAVEAVKYAGEQVKSVNMTAESEKKKKQP